jgi:peroxiredoxin
VSRLSFSRFRPADNPQEAVCPIRHLGTDATTGEQQMKALTLKTGFYAIGLAALLAGMSAAADIDKGAAPDFTLKSSSGENLRLSEFRGEVVMINFWASWCGPCRQEMPLLDELYSQYKPMGFTILGVNVEENSAQAKQMLKENPVNFPVLFDNQSEVSKLYNVVAMPSTVLVDRDGNVRYLHQGYKPGFEEAYQQQVRALIRE